MLTEFGPGIWTAEGPQVVGMMGFHYPTRMAVIRLAGGDLFVWSPVAIDDGLRAAVDTLGHVRYLIAPNAFHHTFLADWQRAYPDAEIHAAPGLREKRPDIRFTAELGDDAAPGWSEEIEQVLVEGNLMLREVVFFHRSSGTAIFADLLQQLPGGLLFGWRRLVAKWDLMLAPEPSVPRKFRVAFANRRAARSSLRRILEWPTEKVLMAHGTPIASNGHAFLQRAFRWLGA